MTFILFGLKTTFFVVKYRAYIGEIGRYNDVYSLFPQNTPGFEENTNLLLLFMTYSFAVSIGSMNALYMLPPICKSLSLGKS